MTKVTEAGFSNAEVSAPIPTQSAPALGLYDDRAAIYFQKSFRSESAQMSYLGMFTAEILKILMRNDGDLGSCIVFRSLRPCNPCLRAGPKLDGAPGEIRTPDPLLRRQMLYPAELRAHPWLLTNLTALTLLPQPLVLPKS